MIYLDNSATTQVMPVTAQAIYNSLTANYFNPSALYTPAMHVEKEMTNARECLLKALNARQYEVIFVSGGTEANNLAINGLLTGKKSGRVLYTAGEHPSVKQACLQQKNIIAQEIPLQNDGRVDLAKLEAMLADDVAMLCIMQVNNETGAVMQLSEIMSLKKRLCNQAFVHVDGVQGFLREPLELQSLGIDSYTLSGHKIHAPKGIGALVLRKGSPLTPCMIGGGQERNLRSGTENVSGIIGLQNAVVNFPKSDIRLVKIHLFEQLKERIPSIYVNGPSPYDNASAPHILNVSFTPVRSETLLHALAGDEVYVGVGSACSSHKQKTSPVLKAMHTAPHVAESAIRFSLNPYITKEEVEKAASLVQKHYEILKKYVRK